MRPQTLTDPHPPPSRTRARRCPLPAEVLAIASKIRTAEDYIRYHTNWQVQIKFAVEDAEVSECTCVRARVCVCVVVELGGRARRPLPAPCSVCPWAWRWAGVHMCALVLRTC